MITLGRHGVVMISTVINCTLYYLAFLAFPFDAVTPATKMAQDNPIIPSSLPLTLVMGVLLGLGDGGFNVSIYGALSKNNNYQYHTSALSIPNLFSQARYSRQSQPPPSRSSSLYRAWSGQQPSCTAVTWSYHTSWGSWSWRVWWGVCVSPTWRDTLPKYSLSATTRIKSRAIQLYNVQTWMYIIVFNLWLLKF